MYGLIRHLGSKTHRDVMTKPDDAAILAAGVPVSHLPLARDIFNKEHKCKCLKVFSRRDALLRHQSEAGHRLKEQVDVSSVPPTAIPLPGFQWTFVPGYQWVLVPMQALQPEPVTLPLPLPLPLPVPVPASDPSAVPLVLDSYFTPGPDTAFPAAPQSINWNESVDGRLDFTSGLDMASWAAWPFLIEPPVVPHPTDSNHSAHSRLNSTILFDVEFWAALSLPTEPHVVQQPVGFTDSAFIDGTFGLPTAPEFIPSPQQPVAIWSSGESLYST